MVSVVEPVTDPQLLAQLNGGQTPPPANGLTPVNDPALLAQLNQPDKIGAKGGLLDTVANAIPDSVVQSAPFRALAGVGGGILQRGIGAIQGGAELLGDTDTAQAAGNAVRDINQNVASMGTIGKVGQVIGDVGTAFALPGGLVSGAVTEAATRPQENPDTVKDRAVNAAINYAGGKALSTAGNVAMRYLKPGAVASTENVLGDAAAGTTQSNAKTVQDILTTEHAKASDAENKAWGLVREQAKGQAVPYKDLNQLHDILINSNSGDPVIDRLTNKVNRFVTAGIGMPAEGVLDIRKALSAASVRDASLRDTVNNVDDLLKTRLGVNGIDDAVKATSSRYQNFVDQKAVASAVADGSTPETVAKLFRYGDTQGADKFDQVLKAVQSTGGNVAAARTNLQKGLAQQILSDAVTGSDKAGGLLVDKTKLADNILDFRKNNATLWNKLTPTQQQAFNTAEKTLRSKSFIGTGAKVAANIALKALPGFVGDVAQEAFKMNGTPINKAVELLKAAPEAAMSRSAVMGKLAGDEGNTSAGVASALAGAGVGAVGATLLAKRHMQEQQQQQQQAPILNTTTVPQTDELGDFIRNLPMAQQISRTVIASEEGNEPKAYKDKYGNTTVGLGFNMDAPNARQIWKRAGVSEKFDDVYKGRMMLSGPSSQKLFDNTSTAAEKAARKIVPTYDNLGDNQKAALTSLVYQLGGKGLGEFRNMLRYLAEGNAKAVENSLINSKLGQKDSPARTRRTALMLAYDIPHDQADAILVKQGRIKPNERKY